MKVIPLNDKLVVKRLQAEEKGVRPGWRLPQRKVG